MRHKGKCVHIRSTCLQSCKMAGFFQSCAAPPSVSPLLCHMKQRGSHSSLIMTRHVGRVGCRRRWERGGFWLRQALFSPRSPGHGTPAGTHLIIHPVRVPRSKWHSNKFRVKSCEVSRSCFGFFSQCYRKKSQPREKHLRCIFCVFAILQSDLVVGQTKKANGLKNILALKVIALILMMTILIKLFLSRFCWMEHFRNSLDWFIFISCIHLWKSS